MDKDMIMDIDNNIDNVEDIINELDEDVYVDKNLEEYDYYNKPMHNEAIKKYSKEELDKFWDT